MNTAYVDAIHGKAPAKSRHSRDQNWMTCRWRQCVRQVGSYEQCTFTLRTEVRKTMEQGLRLGDPPVSASFSFAKNDLETASTAWVFSCCLAISKRTEQNPPRIMPNTSWRHCRSVQRKPYSSYKHGTDHVIVHVSCE